MFVFSIALSLECLLIQREEEECEDVFVEAEEGIRD